MLLKNYKNIIQKLKLKKKLQKINKKITKIKLKDYKNIIRKFKKKITKKLIKKLQKINKKITKIS